MLLSEHETALLGGENPFRERIVRDPWAASEDATDVHAEAGRRLELAARDASLEGRARLCVLVGESGAGKSHLLARVQRRLAGDAFFVFVDPYVDGRRVYRHLRYRLVDSLWDAGRHGGAVASPDKRPLERFIDELLSLAFLTYVQSGDGDDGGDGGDLGPLEPAWRRFVEDVRGGGFYRDPERAELAPWFIRLALGKAADLAGADAIAALVAVRRGEHAGIALDWLRGEDLDPEDLAPVGLPPADRFAPEERARNLVAALASVIRGAGPLVVCFDQTESLPLAPGTDRPDLGALLRATRAICRRARNLVVVVTCLGEVLRASRTDVEPDLTITLPGLATDEARALISARVAPLLAPQTLPYPGYPFDDAFFEGLGRRCSAREVLLAAARVLDRVRRPSVPPAAVADRPGGALDEPRHWRAVFEACARAAASAPEPTDEVLAWSLGTLLEWRSLAGTASPLPGAGVADVAWRSAAGRFCGVVFAGGKDGRSFLGRLRSARAALESRSLGRLVVVRRGDIPDRWESAPRALEGFGAAGGIVIGLDRRSAETLAAVRAIRLAAEAGDVRNPDGTRATASGAGRALLANRVLPPVPILELCERPDGASTER